MGMTSSHSIGDTLIAVENVYSGSHPDGIQ